ncbi:MAG: flagellar hook-associated protein FlgL [Firmicutes bacterium]|nr:flagellar hook-associated protein FlgL [Dethiobacter sp.]MBS3888626.1 flagellar hook-associated protein FlgL [Bacillota bacterium]
MRISNATLRNNVMRNLHSSLREMNEAQRQMASGRTVQVPSDNPIVAGRLLNINATMAESAQFQTNVQDGIAWLNMTDVTLDAVGEALHRARELAIAGASSTLPPDVRAYNATEVDQLLRHVVSLANSSFDGSRHLFGGTHHGGIPFASSEAPDGTLQLPTVVPGAPEGRGAISYEVLRNIEMQVNIPGAELFQDGANSVFGALTMARDALRATPTADVQVSLTALQDALSAVLDARATVGARQNRLDMMDARYNDERTTLSELRSKLGDVDMAEAIMNFNVRESVYQAALGAAARVMQPTLLDFLR